MARTKKPRKTLPVGVARVLKRLHYPLEVILLCVRWYVAYSLSLRDLEEMMAERGFEVFERASLGDQAGTGVRESLSQAQTPGRQELADG
jgi:hypothetical protein